MTITNNIGLYLHIPFCMKKCRYCDFLSFPYSNEKILMEFAEALCREIRIKGNEWPYRIVDSIFIGGGTPSIMPKEGMAKIMDAIYSEFNVADDIEITIEANPATLTDEKMATYLEKGINRISIGVQSFDNSILNMLGRVHNKNDAFNAVRQAKKAGFENINLDLMFGIPNQTPKMWRDTIRQSIFLRPQHISLYSLQVEEGTPFYKMIHEDKVVSMTSEETDRTMYHEALKMLRDAGYNQYEISNVALPGFESTHNMKYWSYQEYLGIGPGASSFISGDRYRNYSNMSNYIKFIKAGDNPIDVEEMQSYSTREEMGIYVFTGLRKTSGIDLDDFKKIFGTEFFDVYDRGILEKYQGFIVADDSNIRLTEKGMDVSNRIMAEFV